MAVEFEKKNCRIWFLGREFPWKLGSCKVFKSRLAFLDHAVRNCARERQFGSLSAFWYKKPIKLMSFVTQNFAEHLISCSFRKKWALTPLLLLVRCFYEYSRQWAYLVIDIDGFTPVLGRGQRAKDPERMKALALSTMDSDDESAPVPPRRSTIRCKAKPTPSRMLNSASNFFENLPVEDTVESATDANDEDYNSDDSLPGLQSCSDDDDDDDDDDNDGDDDVQEISNAEVCLFYMCSYIYHLSTSFRSSHSLFLPRLSQNVAKPATTPAQKLPPNAKQPQSPLLPLLRHLLPRNAIAMSPLKRLRMRVNLLPEPLLFRPSVQSQRYVHTTWIYYNIQTNTNKG